MTQERAWSDEDRERVAEYLRAGKSMGRISRLMGLTRNMVIGRVARDGTLHAFVGRAVVMSKLERDHRPNPHPEPSAGSMVPPLAWEPQGHAIVEVVADLPEFTLRLADAAGRPLVELRRHDCRWPVADDDSVIGGMRFCGAPQAPGHVYCPEHRRAAGRSVAA